LRIAPGQLSNGTDPCSVTGEWRAASRIVVRAPVQQVDRCAKTWSAKGPGRVTFALWSKQRTLAPGERSVLDVEYERVTPGSRSQ
jgi:hypothetical protein